MKKWITGINIVVVILIGLHIGVRWHMLRRVYITSEAKSRIQIVPSELNLSDMNVPYGNHCNVGYAEFMTPSTNPVTMALVWEDGSWLRGKCDNVSYALMTPFDPLAGVDVLAESNSLLSKQPENEWLRKKLGNPSPTALDMEIQLENALPPSFWEMVTQDRASFAFNIIQLAIKGGTSYGSKSMHIYRTEETRGLIRVGKQEGRNSCALVSIENLKGTQAVGLLAHLPEGEAGNIMSVLPTVLKTFRFTVEHLDEKDEIKRLISEAGIKPEEPK